MLEQIKKMVADNLGVEESKSQKTHHSKMTSEQIP